VSGILGLWKAGLVDGWGLSAQQDNWNWTQLDLKDVCPPDIILRMDVGAASLGATYFRLEYGETFLNYKAQTRTFSVAEGARLDRDLWQLILKKGLIQPIRPEALLVSPIAFQLRYNTALQGMVGGEAQRKGDPRLTGGLFDSHPYWQRASEQYVSRILYGTQYYVQGILTSTPCGCFAIYPEYVDPQKIPGVSSCWVTDGKSIFLDTVPTDVSQIKDRLSAAYQEAAQQLPFRADGVFFSTQKLGRNEYEIFLLDPGYFEVQDRKTHLKINLAGGNWKVKDRITGHELQSSDGREFAVEIPAGTFRILTAARH
jgi:hypothetical protein